MASGTRSCVFLIALGALWAGVTAEAAPAARQNLSPEGAIYTFGSGPSGEAVLSIDTGSLHVDKSVAADGASSISIRANGDEVKVDVTSDGVVVSGATGKASFAANGSDEAGQQAVRMALARSGSAQLFRSFAARVSARGGRTAFDQAVALSGAVIGQLAGDPDALREFARQHRAPTGAVRPAAARLTTDCWGQYEQYISWAYEQYLYCLTDARRILFISSYSYCEFQYTMRAESAWFQFLSCSTIPMV